MRFPPDYKCPLLPMLPMIRGFAEPFRDKCFRSQLYRNPLIDVRDEEDASKGVTKQT